MVDRVKKIILEKNLSSSGFADKIGVPRSTISHILSGRNNPSLELVQKILDTFPDLRTEWLVRGKGDMFTGAPRDLFSLSEEATEDKIGENNYQDDNSKKEAESVASEARRLAENNEKTHEGLKEEKAVKAMKGDKIIDKIIALYTDGTFSSYGPSGE